MSNGRSVPFGLFERMLAGRYLRAKRQHGGVALISVISVIAITLGGVGADHHHVGDERLPRDAAVAHPRRQRPRLRRRAQSAGPGDRPPGGARRAKRPTCCTSRRSSTRRALATSDGMAAGVIVRGIPRDRACSSCRSWSTASAAGGGLRRLRRRRIADHPRRRSSGRIARRARRHGDLDPVAAGRARRRSASRPGASRS